MARFGVLGAGNIAHRFARSLAHVEGAELVAASRRSRAGARQFLDEVPAASGARAYGSHAELLEDGEVDAIYLALPHEFHREWATRAIEAGKAVLCEKPAMLTAADMVRVADLARERGVLFMEAMKPRFVPLYPLIVQALPSLGAIRLVEASLCNDMLSSVMEAGTYHMTPGPGAGVLLDCGTYCAAWIEDLCPGVPRLTSVDGRQVRDVDVHVDACMDYGGIKVRLECAFDRAKPRVLRVVGTEGSLLVEELHRPQHAVLRLEGEPPRSLGAPYAIDDLYDEIAHFVGLAEMGALESPVMSARDSVHAALILDVVRAGLASR